MNKLKVGDTIKCHNKEEMVEISEALAREDIITDFLYEKDGEKGLWLTVEAVLEKDIPSVAEIKQKICDDYCRYPKEHLANGDYLRGRELMDIICEECPLNYLED